MSSTAATDRQDLAALGYKQELDRTLGSFSAFAAGFSYLSILTGMFQLFHEGLNKGGPAFFWTWPVVFLGQFLVALCFAELAAHYPLSGGVYQWSKHVGSGAIGWLAGWVYLANLIISISAVALALQVTLPRLAPWFQVIGDGTRAEDSANNAVLLGCLLILFTTLINSVGVGWLAKINNLGVFAELAGVSLLILLLAWHAQRGPSIVFDTQGKGVGPPFGYLGPLLAAGLMASYVMYGFDTAGALAEETTAPRRRAPRAILQALVACALAGALLMLTALMAATDFNRAAIEGLPHIVQSTLGEEVGAFFLGDVVFAITVCALAVHTSTVRLMFAMARDNNLPLGRLLARVSPTSRTPLAPALLAGVLAAIILVVNLNIPGFIDLVAPVAVLWANLAYLLVTAPLLYRRARGWPDVGGSGAPGLFALGKAGMPVNVLAVVWGILMLVNIGWPRPEIYGEAWYLQYGPLLLTGGLLGSGGLYYGLVQRYKTGVLPEHRAREPSGKADPP